ncbi:MAG: hypothetical protein M5R36_16950 [Deltaproteobacteria bacterium]|nr:hypothetical protein [Deltaproteobacteria bacterium]
MRQISLLGGVLAALALAVSGCAGAINFNPAGHASYEYEQTRTVTLSLLGLNFMSNEVLRYRQDVEEVGPEEIEMSFTPIEYTITTSTGDGVRDIHGTKFLRQPGENPDVSLLRDLAGKRIRVRARRDGTIARMHAEGGAGDIKDATDLPRVEELNDNLKRIFIQTHLLLTQNILPAESVREGQSYRPSGEFAEMGDDGETKLMMLGTVDDKGGAHLRVDPKIIDSLFKDASSAVPLPPALEGQIAFAGEGSGDFVFDTKRRCVTSGSVAFNARAEQAESKGRGPAPFSVRVAIGVKEVTPAGSI